MIAAEEGPGGPVPTPQPIPILADPVVVMLYFLAALAVTTALILSFAWLLSKLQERKRLKAVV